MCIENTTIHRPRRTQSTHADRAEAIVHSTLTQLFWSDDEGGDEAAEHCKLVASPRARRLQMLLACAYSIGLDEHALVDVMAEWATLISESCAENGWHLRVLIHAIDVATRMAESRPTDDDQRWIAEMIEDEPWERLQTDADSRPVAAAAIQIIALVDQQTPTNSDGDIKGTSPTGVWMAAAAILHALESVFTEPTELAAALAHCERSASRCLFGVAGRAPAVRDQAAP